MRTSEKLVVGNVYTRQVLKELFSIKDATINNGIFRPKGHDSIWLFITEEKTPDKPQYVDCLQGEDLHMDGQGSGRTDERLIQHESDGLELILFHRKHKNEHPDCGFRYEGKFQYIDHRGLRPAHFHLRRVCQP